MDVLLYLTRISHAVGFDFFIGANVLSFQLFFQWAKRLKSLKWESGLYGGWSNRSKLICEVKGLFGWPFEVENYPEAKSYQSKLLIIDCPSFTDYHFHNNLVIINSLTHNTYYFLLGCKLLSATVRFYNLWLVQLLYMILSQLCGYQTGSALPLPFVLPFSVVSDLLWCIHDHLEQL